MSDLFNPIGRNLGSISGPTLLTGVVADPPRSLLGTRYGTILKGTVLGKGTDGQTTIATDKGTVSVATNAQLPAGSAVTLEVRNARGDRCAGSDPLGRDIERPVFAVAPTASSQASSQAGGAGSTAPLIQRLQPPIPAAQTQPSTRPAPAATDRVSSAAASRRSWFKRRRQPPSCRRPMSISSPSRRRACRSRSPPTPRQQESATPRPGAAAGANAGRAAHAAEDRQRSRCASDPAECRDWDRDHAQHDNSADRHPAVPILAALIEPSLPQVAGTTLQPEVATRIAALFAVASGEAAVTPLARDTGRRRHTADNSRSTPHPDSRGECSRRRSAAPIAAAPVKALVAGTELTLHVVAVLPTKGGAIEIAPEAARLTGTVAPLVGKVLGYTPPAMPSSTRRPALLMMQEEKPACRLALKWLWFWSRWLRAGRRPAADHQSAAGSALSIERLADPR